MIRVCRSIIVPHSVRRPLGAPTRAPISSTYIRKKSCRAKKNWTRASTNAAIAACKESADSTLAFTSASSSSMLARHAAS